MKNYPNVEDYLLGVDRVSESYATLMPSIKINPKLCLFLTRLIYSLNKMLINRALIQQQVLFQAKNALTSLVF